MNTVTTPPLVVLDTNIWVGAGFNPDSNAARIVEAIAAGEVRLVYDAATLAETKAVVEKIPPLRWSQFAPLFEAAEPFEGAAKDEDLSVIADPSDRKFAALAAAANAVLVSNDAHLLSVRDVLPVRVLRSGEFVEAYLNQ